MDHCISGYNDGINGVNPATTEGSGPSTSSSTSSSSEAAHCDKQRWPDCYSLGYKAAQQSGAGHWLQGYKDGYRSICGNLQSREDLNSCSSPPP